MPLSSDKHIIDEQFGSALENFRVKPSGKVWWRLSHSLNFKQKNYSTRRILLLSGLLMLIASSAGLLEATHHSKILSLKHRNKEAIQQPVAIVPENGKSNPEKNCRQWSNCPMICQKEGKQIDVQPIDFQYKTAKYASSVYPSFGRPAEAITMLPAHAFSLKNDLPFAEKIHAPTLVCDHETVAKPPKSYYLGLSISLNNTWLLDREAIRSISLKYEPTVGLSYGMQGGYIFSKRWGMQMAWILNSWQGQRYKNIDLYGRTTSLEYNHKNIALTYMQFPLLVQYRTPIFSEMLNTPVIFNITVGGQYGAMIAYRIDNVKNEALNKHLFRKNEFAAVIGFDYDFMTKRPVFYSLGLRASYGTNIFKKNQPNYLEFDAPHNLLIGIHGAVNFSLSK